MEQPNFDSLTQQFDGPGVRAIVLMGSYARGDAGPFSDVDLLRLTDEEPQGLTGEGSHLIDERLVTVSNAAPARVDAWFTEPNKAVAVVASLRDARALLDRNNAFAQVQARANAFVWDSEMQAKANAYASQEMIGWIEEAHKGLEGLRRLKEGELDAGRLLNARFGLSHGLSHVMQVQRGILSNSDNAFYDAITKAIGHDSEWSRLCGIAFAIGTVDGRQPTVPEQVEAGLRLYVETVRLLGDAIQPEHKPFIERTVARIRAALHYSAAS